jgi:hypothetical protein
VEGVEVRATARRRDQRQGALIESLDYGLDGMLCVVDGNLYITPFGKGTALKVSPSGQVIQEIDGLGGLADQCLVRRAERLHMLRHREQVRPAGAISRGSFRPRMADAQALGPVREHRLPVLVQNHVLDLNRDLG